MCLDLSSAATCSFCNLTKRKQVRCVYMCCGALDYFENYRGRTTLSTNGLIGLRCRETLVLSVSILENWSGLCVTNNLENRTVCGK